MSGSLTNLNRMRIAGKEWHPQTGLIDFGARFYHPIWQRWMNADPIGFDGGPNLYAYVGNSPFTYIDPYGLTGVEVLNVVPQAVLDAMVAEGNAILAREALMRFGAAGVTAVAGYWVGNELGEKLGWHDKIARHLVPDIDSSPLPLPGGARKPPRPPGKPPTDTTTSAPCPGGNGKGGENEYTARGREAHKWYNYPEGFRTDFRFENGMRPDAINFQTRQILELKPNNPEAIARGFKQLEAYIQQATTEFGGSWSGRVVTY